MQSFKTSISNYPSHGWLGLLLIVEFWCVNWIGDGLRTSWAFFPLWLGYCLAVDGMVYIRKGTSLLTRSKLRYLGLFGVSVLGWWLFEMLNWRTQNWAYLGVEIFLPPGVRPAGLTELLHGDPGGVWYGRAGQHLWMGEAT